MDLNVFKRVLAPMAGFTDAGFRKLASMHGATLTVTEMVSAKGLVYGSRGTAALLAGDSAAAQIFGSDPAIIAAAVQHPALSKFSIIDINMGCPVPKIVKNGEGSALLLNPQLAGEIIKAARLNSDKIITAKIRTGYYSDEIFPSGEGCPVRGGVVLSDFVKNLEANGAHAIAVHGRTKEQGYSGLADRGKIAEVVRAVKIPVIANGDIKTEDDIEKMLEETNAAGVMIGRGALKNLKIFGKDLGLSKRELCTIHTEELLKHFEERSVVNIMKAHLCHAGSKETRKKAGGMKTLEDLRNLIYNI